MLDSYVLGNAGALMKRIGTPHEHDILCGRGGAINAHIGNQHFREYVHERKNRYNLARTKLEKASVANEVMDLVKNNSGRFLQRDQSSSLGGTTWWVECDEVKSMAKTSQALREGAPSIRAAHKDDLKDFKKRTRKSKKTSNSTATVPRTSATTAGKRSHQIMQEQQETVPSAPVALNVAMEQLKANVEAAKQTDNTPMTSSYTPALASPPPLTTLSYAPPIKKSKLSENLYLPLMEYSYLPQPHIVKPDDTPPIAPLPSPLPLHAIPDIDFDDNFPMPAIPKRESSTTLRRTNSLALSDVGSGFDSWGDLDFVNPFEGDDNLSLPPLSPFPTEQRNYSNATKSSVTSDLSDLSEAFAPADSEFGEAMKDVYDAVHPGLASPGTDEPIPTHLYPYTPSATSSRRMSMSGSGSFSSPQLIC